MAAPPPPLSRHSAASYSRGSSASATGRSAQRQVFDPVRVLLRLTRAGNQLQVADAVPVRRTFLVSENDPHEGDAGLKSAGRDRQEVLILREQHAAQFASSVEQLFVVSRFAP